MSSVLGVLREIWSASLVDEGDCASLTDTVRPALLEGAVRLSVSLLRLISTRTFCEFFGSEPRLVEGSGDASIRKVWPSRIGVMGSEGTGYAVCHWFLT